jgi:hypothetical protein
MNDLIIKDLNKHLAIFTIITFAFLKQKKIDKYHLKQKNIYYNTIKDFIFASKYRQHVVIESFAIPFGLLCLLLAFSLSE